MELRDIGFIIDAHNNKAKNVNPQVRKWDGKTPYYVHPIWCASMLLQETQLPEEIRLNGSQALLYHDVLEDTDAGLPGWLSQEVKELILDMTFASSQEEREKVWEKSQQIRLLKLYDKVSNMFDGIWMSPQAIKIHKEHLKKLTIDVEKNYGGINIVKMAKTLL